MSDFLDYGFRFYIVGVKDGKYGVRDLSDLETEYYSFDEVLEMSKKVQIMGVVGDSIKLDWFQGYVRREWTFRKSDIDFELKFGMTYTKGVGDIMMLQPVVFEGESNIFFKLEFFEFINSFSYHEHCGSVFFGSDTDRNIQFLLMREIEQIEAYGLGFNFITEPVLVNYPNSLINIVDFDKYVLGSSKITIKLLDSTRDYHISGRIRTSRHLRFVADWGTDLILDKCETKNGGSISVFSGIAWVSVSAGFLSTAKFDYASLSLPKLLRCENEFVIPCFLRGRKFNLGVSPSFKCEIDSKIRDCIVIHSGINSSGSIICEDNLFVFMDGERHKVFMQIDAYKKFISESDFEKRHNISLEEFRELCYVSLDGGYTYVHSTEFGV